MNTDNNDWKDLIIQDQLISKDKEIEALFEQLKIKDEQISKYQTKLYKINSKIESKPNHFIPWTLSAVASILFFVLTVNFIQVRNDLIAKDSQSIYLTERLELQRDSLAQKSALINGQNHQIVELHNKLQTNYKNMAIIEQKLNKAHEQDIELSKPVDIATE